MQERSPREKILTNIRNALINKTKTGKESVAGTTDVYRDSGKDPAVLFAETLQQANGNFIYCETLVDFANGLKGLMDTKGWKSVFCQDDSLQKLLKEAKIPYRYSENLLSESKASLTRCEYLVARFGSAMVSSKTGTGRKAYIIPEVHIILAFTTQVVMDIKDAIMGIRQRYKNQLPSMVSLITGPSRTADIEKTLVMGAHGPKELYVFMIEA